MNSQHQKSQESEKSSAIGGAELTTGKSHYPRKYMTKHGNTITYVFSCCGRVREFNSRAGRDQIASIHNEEYANKKKGPL